jgi:hypothetical protein
MTTPYGVFVGTRPFLRDLNLFPAFPSAEALG